MIGRKLTHIYAKPNDIAGRMANLKVRPTGTTHFSALKKRLYSVIVNIVFVLSLTYYHDFKWFTSDS